MDQIDPTTTPAKKKRASGYRYKGSGDFLPGIPARDLSADEIAALPDQVESAGVDVEKGEAQTRTRSAAELIESSGLYERVTP